MSYKNIVPALARNRTEAPRETDGDSEPLYYEGHFNVWPDDNLAADSFDPSSFEL